MANTKVSGDLIANGAISHDHLHANHGITTSDIGEGASLYYTDSRVASYLTANDYVTQASIPTVSQFLTSLNLTGSTLSYIDEDNATTNIDLSSLGYLTSFTETDPIYTASSWYTTTNNAANWDTAYGWGDHASAGYATSSNGTDSTVPSHVKAITTTSISNWDTAYGWGDHSTQSYATQTYVNTAVAGLVDAAPTTLDTLNELAAALGDDPNFATTVSTSIGTKWTQDNAKISNWDTAFGYGNHASAGYLTSISEATSTVRGGIELFSDTDQSVAANTITATAGRTYGIQLNSAGQAVVNVPWVDTNTTYSVGNGGLTQINFTSALNTKLAGIATGATNVTNTNQLTNGAGFLTTLPSHNHDDRYYTESESISLFARRDTSTNINGNLLLGNTAYGQSNAYANWGSRLFFNGSDADAQGNYYIGTNPENYGGNYSKLDLRWHTGIRMGAQPGYGGTRIYNSEDLGTVLFSVGTGDTHVRVTNNLYAPIFYDSNDTGYYGDFASTSRLNILDLAGYGYVVGQTTNGQSHYQWDGATFRNPGTYTSRLIVRQDNTNTGINGFMPSLVIHNNHGGDQTTSGIVFTSAEGVTGAGNTVNLAGIIAKKESAGNVGAWSPGSLTFFVKDFATRRDGMFIASSGYVQSDYSFRSPIFYDSNNTAYYVDPNSTSRFNNIYVVGGVAGISNSSSYTQAALEVRERGFGGAQDDTFATAPRISFHWGGRVASQIAMSSNGWINILNNPGSGYESFRAGAIYSNGDVTAYYSDVRLKEIQGPIENALKSVLSIETFKYKNNHIAKQNGFVDDDVHIGVSAQSVESVLPEIVKHAPFDIESKDGEIISKTGEWYKTVQYEKLVPLLIEAIKEQQVQIEELKSLLNK